MRNKDSDTYLLRTLHKNPDHTFVACLISGQKGAGVHALKDWCTTKLQLPFTTELAEKAQTLLKQLNTSRETSVTSLYETAIEGKQPENWFEDLPKGVTVGYLIGFKAYGIYYIATLDLNGWLAFNNHFGEEIKLADNCCHTIQPINHFKETNISLYPQALVSDQSGDCITFTIPAPYQLPIIKIAPTPLFGANKKITPKPGNPFTSMQKKVTTLIPGNPFIENSKVLPLAGNPFVQKKTAKSSQAKDSQALADVTTRLASLKPTDTKNASFIRAKNQAKTSLNEVLNEHNAAALQGALQLAKQDQQHPLRYLYRHTGAHSCYGLFATYGETNTVKAIQKQLEQYLTKTQKL